MEKLSTEDLTKMYYYMVLTREFEARMGKLLVDGKIDEAIHRSIGQEAVGVGATYCLRKKEDVMVPSLRSRAAFFVKGLDVNSVMEAVYGKRTALTGGKESSHHLGSMEPQSAILGVGKIVKRPIVVDDQIEIRPMVYICASYDHRIIPGAVAQQFLEKVKLGIEGVSPDG